MTTNNALKLEIPGFLFNSVEFECFLFLFSFYVLCVLCFSSIIGLQLAPDLLLLTLGLLVFPNAQLRGDIRSVPFDRRVDMVIFCCYFFFVFFFGSEHGALVLACLLFVLPNESF